MILVDTPVWIDHLRAGDDLLAFLLREQRVLMHPFVKGEIALCNLRARARIMAELDGLPHSIAAHDDEVLRLIETGLVAESGIGYVDAHLLASARLTSGATLLTRDSRLAALAARLNLAAKITH